MPTKIVKETEPKGIIVNQIILRNADRSPKDIQKVRTAQIYAESVAYANRVPLYDLYDDVMLDGHLTGIWKKRVDAVLNKSLHYEDTAGIRIEDMDTLIESNTFRDMQRKIMESEAWGLSGMEFIPGKKFEWIEIPRKHIKPDLKIIAKEQNGSEGFPYDTNPFLWVIGGKNDYGFLLKCSYYAVYKRGNLADWAQYCEIFGQPVRVIKYDAYDTKTKIELQQVLDESGSSLALMIPKQADFDMKDGKVSNADGQLQDRFKTAMNEEMSIIVLTVTETANASKSSGYAQSKEHGKQQLEVTKSDLKYMANMLNSDVFKNILKSYGYPEGRFVYEKEIDLDELKTRLEIDMQVKSNVPVDDDYWYDTYAIPKPKNYDELKKKMEEDKQMFNQSLSQSQAYPKSGPKKEVSKNLNDLGFWDKLRTQLADFFDPAQP
mgnify:CR=1 FL=1